MRLYQLLTLLYRTSPPLLVAYLSPERWLLSEDLQELDPFCIIFVPFFLFGLFCFWVFMPCSRPQFPVVPVIPTGPRSMARGWALLKREVKE